MMKKLFAMLLLLLVFVLPAQAETLTVVNTVEPTVELPGSSDELFAAYAEQELYAPIYGKISLFGTSARAKLTEQQKLIYDVLKAKIVDVANNGGSTQFVFNPADITRLKTTFTLADLGVTAFAEVVNGNTQFTAATSTALINFYFGDVLDALLHDCPLELYWFEKTLQGAMQQGMSASYNDTELTVTQLIVIMQVADNYQGSSTTVVKLPI